MNLECNGKPHPQIHPFSNLHLSPEQSPPIIERGEGIYLIDTSGTKYLDAMSSLWCVTLGYSQPRLVEAAQRQLSDLPYSHSFRGRSSPSANKLAEKLIDISPNQMTNVFFASSGSEANESAIKIAWSFHKSKGEQNRRKIFSHQKSYHGSAIFSALLSGSASMHEHQNCELTDIIFTTTPDFHHEALSEETEEDFSNRLVTDLEDRILRERPETVAAFIAEPVMGVGGVIIPPKNYFKKIQKVLSRYGILFIADEVICGFGRTGNMFGSQTFNLTPDIMTAAKGLSSAYFPISAVLTSKKVNEGLTMFSKQNGLFSHGFTYSGHPVGAAVAMETIKIIERNRILDHVKSVSKIFKLKLNELMRTTSLLNARSVGLMGAFDIVVPKTRQPDRPATGQAGNKLMDLAQKHCLFIRAVGDTIVLAPPLIISESEINILFERLNDAICDWQKCSS